MKLSESSTGIFCWTFIFLCVAFTTKASDSGDSLYARGEYSKAALEYEYQYFVSASNLQRSLALIKKAECYTKTGAHKKAAETLDRVDVADLCDSLQRDIHKRLAFSSYLSENMSKAQSHLFRFETECTDSSQIAGMLPLFTLVENELQNWNEARTKLVSFIRLTYTGPTRDSLIKKAEDLYSEENQPRLKKLKKAQIMSAFLPGLGQMYAGYILDGMASSALVLGSVAFTVYSVVTAHYVTAAVIGYGLMSKFYQGGIKHLEYLVSKTNYERSRKYNDSLKVAVLQISGK